MPPSSNSGTPTAKKSVIKVKMPASPAKKSATNSEEKPIYDPRMTKDHTLAVHGSIILIRVGSPIAQDWAVHQSLICTKLDMFKMMFSNDCQESRSGLVTLKEDEPRTFEVYVQWLYTSKILVTTRSNGADDFTGWEDLVKAYILGDKFQDCGFVDAVIDAIIAESNTVVDGFKYYPIRRITKLVCDNTHDGSPLRRLIIDQHVHHGVQNWVSETGAADMNKDFFLDLVRALFESRPKPLFQAPDEGVSTCFYHEHEKSGKPCYKT